MKNKIKGLGVSALSGALAFGAVGAPINVMAEGQEELVPAGDKVNDYGFVYNKTTTKEGRKPSLYALRLDKGLTATGASFEPTEDQKREASKVVKSNGTEEKRVQVDYDGLYTLINLQREPGHYPYLEESMHTSEGYFEFPNKDGHNITQKVELKEQEFINALDVILRGPVNNKLSGEFDLIQVGEPQDVYGNYTKDELKYIDEGVLTSNEYNIPATAAQKNKVKSWKKVNKEIAKLDISDETEVDWSLRDGSSGIASEVENAIRTDGIEEGIYKLSQTKSEGGYNLRSDVFFAVTLNDKGEPVLEHLKDDSDLNSRIDDFEKKSEYEYFYNSMIKDNSLSLYQALLVNHNIPGISPKHPSDPSKNAGGNFFKYGKRLGSLNFTDGDMNDYYVEEGPGDDEDPGDDQQSEDYMRLSPMRNSIAPANGYLDEDGFSIINLDGRLSYMGNADSIENSFGSKIKINAGEMFALNFTLNIPENIGDYEYLEFVDILDDNIMFSEDFTEENIKDLVIVGFEEYADNLIKDVSFSSEEGKKYIKIEFDIQELKKHVDDFVKNADDDDVSSQLYTQRLMIGIGGLYVKEGAEDDILNRGYIYYKEGKNETPTPKNPWERPDDKDVINPEDPTESLKPGDPTKPTIPTTPEIKIDPITVNFRMGVVDGGTTVLDNAKYEITDFKPTRGEGGIDEEGFIYVGNAKYNIHKEIDAAEGFVKLKGLPAGRYTMVETVAPVKDDDQYRLVTQTLEFRVKEDESTVTIIQPIVKNGSESPKKNTIITESIYGKMDYSKGRVVLDEEKWGSEEVLDDEAMLHHYRYINTPETGTLAQIPFFLGGGVAVSSGLIMVSRKKKKKDK